MDNPKTYNRSWILPLRRSLRADPSARVAVLGVGQMLAGDDGVGCLIARRLQAVDLGAGRWLVRDTGVAPEACTGPVRKFSPQLVVLIDAVDMGLPPGAIAWFETWSGAGFSASTHGLPLDVVAEYLRNALSCKVFLLGVQPGNTTFGADLTPPVADAAAAIVRALRRVATSFHARRAVAGVNRDVPRPGECGWSRADRRGASGPA